MELPQMEQEQPPWAPLPYPTRESPYYTLRSVAFSKDMEPAVPAVCSSCGNHFLDDSLFCRKCGRKRLVAAPTQAANLAAVGRGVSGDAPSGLDEDSSKQFADLQSRRSAALSQCQKVQEQLARATKRLAQTRQEKIAAQQESEDIRRRSEGVAVMTQLARQDTYNQQIELRALRQRLRQVRNPAAFAAEQRAAHQRAAADAAAPVVSEHQAAIADKDAPAHPGTTRDAASEERQSAGNDTAECVAENALPAIGGAIASAQLKKKEDSPGWHQSSLASIPSRRSMQSAPSGQTLKTSSSAASVNEGLEDLINDMQLVRQICSAPTTTGAEGFGLGLGPILPAAAATGDSWLPDGCVDWEADEDDEAEIDLLKQPNNVTLARLRHPSGAEVLLDLGGAFVLAWRLADGRVAAGAGTRVVSALQPVVPLVPEGATIGFVTDDDSDPTVRSSADAGHGCEFTTSWRLMLLDDSNNEPSATLTCDGGGDEHGASWRCRRSYTLGPNWLREEVFVENLALATPIAMGEEVPDESLVSDAAALMKPSLATASSAKVFLRSDHNVILEDEEGVTTVPPCASWSHRRWWVAEADSKADWQ